MEGLNRSKVLNEISSLLNDVRLIGYEQRTHRDWKPVTSTGGRILTVEEGPTTLTFILTLAPERSGGTQG